MLYYCNIFLLGSELFIIVKFAMRDCFQHISFQMYSLYSATVCEIISPNREAHKTLSIYITPCIAVCAGGRLGEQARERIKEKEDKKGISSSSLFFMGCAVVMLKIVQR